MSDIDLRLAIEKHYKSPVLAGKGGFWIKGHGFITTAKARKITGIKGKTRNPPQRLAAWGDYATVAMLNQPRRRK